MRFSAVLVVTTLLMFIPGAGWAGGVSEPGQAAVAQPPHDAAAHDQPSPAKEHDHAAMLAAQAAAAPSEIDALVKKMNGARGQAKIAIMADLITKLVAERQSASSGHSMPASGGMCGGSGGASATGSGHDMSCPMCAAHMKGSEPK